ncbi:MAG: hypothetical protein EOM24_34435 [Chloroflexia bacterium]|nr:hypothetical protein [Chloroflexia bacterium]
MTPKTSDAKHARNAADLDAFVSVLSGGKVPNVTPGSLVGPFHVPGHPLITTPVDRFIGKASRTLR